MLVLFHAYEKAALEIESEPYVHSFYRDMFAAQYGIERSSAGGGEGQYLTRTQDYLSELLILSAENYKDRITRYFDVRTTEEYEQTSPEYGLLCASGLKEVRPVSIKGQGRLALLEAMKISRQLLLKEGGMHLMSFAAIYNSLDRALGVTEKGGACSFLLTEKEMPEPWECKVKQLVMPVERREAERLIVDFNGDLIYSEDISLLRRANHKLLAGKEDIFAYLRKKAVGSRTALTILCWQGRYGVLELEMGEDFYVYNA